MILTEKEINKISGGSVDYFDRIVFARAIEAALLAKLRGGAEMPKPYDGEQSVFEDWLHDCAPSGDAESVQAQWLASFEYRSFVEKHEFTCDQLLAYGAAQRLAGREQVLKEATALDWTAIMREGGLVTWGDAETLGDRVVEHIRAIAASPQPAQGETK